MNETIKIVGEEVLADNWAVLKNTTFEVTRRDGSRQTLHRETYDHGNAAALLLCDRQRRMVVLTRQFRFPAHLNGDPAWLVEVCAGLLDGDTPETCARREAEEETGYRPTTVTHVFDAYMSPGSLTEKVSCFLGDYDAAAKISAGGGLHEEGEDIEVMEIPFTAAIAMIASGEIIDGKTIMLLQHAALTGYFG
ncbi:MAG TPA: NUDIX domain-containing protein [Devosiaceae bacterium]|jgi:nudix-type nucleoside diphosphatase (YffH/AdpP family)